MSKFCELAGKVTNGTDDCKICLEEERLEEAEGKNKEPTARSDEKD